MRFFVYVLCIAALTGNSSAQSLETPNMKAPAVPETVHQTPTTDGFLSEICLCVLSGYSTWLNPVISRGCPSYPTCSHYMKLAIQTFGVPAGLIVGLGRMLHESGEIHYGTVILTNSGYRIYDPLENNTFWWRSHAVD